MKPRVHSALVNDPFGDPGLYLDFLFERRALLFDLGDIAVLPTRKILRLSHVFVSHAHMDHFAGFDRLLRLSLGRDKRLSLFGPPGFIERVEHKLKAYTWNRIRDYPGDFVLQVFEYGGQGSGRAARFRSREAFAHQDEGESAFPDGSLLAEDGFIVRASLLDHDTPSLAFALEEASHVNVFKSALEAKGLAVGPWLGALKSAARQGLAPDTPIRCARSEPAGGGEVALPLGELCQSVLSVGSGQKIAYAVDLVFTEANARRLAALASAADLLFIEAVFLEQDAALAAQRFHLTARQAGEIARRAGAKRAIPFHFSPRYADRPEALAAEFEAAFAAAA